MHDFPTYDEATEERAAKTLFFVESSFGRVPAAHTDYLLVLNAKAHELTEALVCMRAVLANASPASVENDVSLLLRAVNWRFHNIACLALLSRPPSVQLTHELWAAIERGSWTSPQLAATAAIVDPRFEERAQSLICSRTTYYKSIVSLEALLRRNGSVAELAAEAQANVSEAASLDRDDSGGIALERLREFEVASGAA